MVVPGVMNEGHSLQHDLRVLEQGAGWLPLAGDGLVRVTGAGHREALQRVVSQDVLGLQDGQGALALLLAPKGQFLAIMGVFVGAERTYLVAPPGRAGELTGRLTKYLALSRCTAEPVVAAGAFAVVGIGWRQAVGAAGAEPDALAGGGWTTSSEAVWFGRTLLGVPGAVAVVQEPGAVAAVRDALGAGGASPVSEEAVEIARIRVGWPAWGAELTESVLPPEVGIEDEAISYTKGCYIGQETIARMKTYGHPTRALVGLRQSSGSGDRPPLPMAVAAEGEAKTQGSLTSWGWHPRLGGFGLAIVRRKLAEPGTRLAAGGREFEVSPLPLW